MSDDGRVESRAQVHVRGPFARLGELIVGHAKLVVLVWVLFLLAAAPLLTHIGNATTSSALTIPSSEPSSQEAKQAGQVFPNATVNADTLVLLSGPDITGVVGRDATLAVTRALENDTHITSVGRVDSLYTTYQSYLNAEETARLAVLRPGFVGNASLFDAMDGTSQLLWGTAGLYLSNWATLYQAGIANGSMAPPNSYNAPAYQRTLSNPALSNQPLALQNLSLFYHGYLGGPSPDGWNASNGCWGSVPNQSLVSSCTASMVRALHSDPVAAGLRGGGFLDRWVLAQLNLTNFSYTPPVQWATLHFLALTSGVPFPDLNATWATWSPDTSLDPSSSALDAWSYAIISSGTPATYATPVPPSILGTFVDGAANNVTVIVIALNVSDQGPQAQRVVSDVDRLTPLALSQVGAAGTIGWVQTGDAALVITESNLINQDTNAILPITVVLLLAITALYFRAPLTPVLVLLTIGLALLLGLAAMVITTTFTGQVTDTSLTLLVTFSLGVGTDYSVFLTARYREELWSGKEHREALVNAVTWAGESIATSGSTVVLATLAMTFSGASLITDWGKVLSTGVTIAILVALTLVPAVLYLIGPRIFWPYTGERFRKQAAARNLAVRRRNTYFHRASRVATKRPATVLLLATLVSIPLVYLALTAPQSYSYFGQLPPSQPATQGLNELSGNFGPGYVFPLDILVTFQTPLVETCTAAVPSAPVAPGLACPPNSNVAYVSPTELAEANGIAHLLTVHSGVRSVNSMFGSGGAPLPTWLNLTSALPVPQATLLATLTSYVGNDGTTVDYTVALDSNGNTNEGVNELNSIEGNLSSFTATHPTVSHVYYGGAASITKDLQAQLAESAQRMELIIIVGLLLVLFLALGSAVLPPLALITIALSAAWSWALSYAVFVLGLELSLFFYIPPVLFLLIMGLGMDYNIFILTRIREERLKGSPPRRAVIDAVAHTAGIITAAAVILGGAFFALVAAQVSLLRVLGFAVGAAVILDAAVVRTYLVPAILGASRDRIWWRPNFLRAFRRNPAEVPIRPRPMPTRLTREVSRGRRSVEGTPPRSDQP
ncbi:MAG: MMPL family transporter [Euryarchaeota archaeon]|nr:MMPL family transporter [Euryarchaeota archaeon]MDE2043798.1 MMPL family transporter [Thermoplasmata archaeon]